MASRVNADRGKRSGEEGRSLEAVGHEEMSPRAAESRQEHEFYFDAPQESAEPALDADRLREREVEAGHEPLAGPDLGAPLRTQTTPARLQRQSTRSFAGLKRTDTGAQASDNPRDPFQSTFDPLSSDTDTTSSSEHELDYQKEKEQAHEPATRQRTRPKAYTTAKDQNVTDEERRGKSYSRFAVGNDAFKTQGRVSKRDGRLKISINETANSGYVAKVLGQSIRNHLNVPKRDKSGRRRSTAQTEKQTGEISDSHGSRHSERAPCPRLNIVIMVIGSRGDIQPFLQIGKILKHKHGHRVRIASHPTFRDFVEKEVGLEFFSVGGDPSELMAFVS